MGLKTDIEKNKNNYQECLYKNHLPSYEEVTENIENIIDDKGNKIVFNEINDISENLIREVLQKCIKLNKLEKFYPNNKKIDEIVNNVIFKKDKILKLIKEWKIDGKMGIDLIQLALYDIVLYIDDSGSMNFENRIEDTKIIIEKIAEVMTIFDHDGISVRFINTDEKDLESQGIKTDGINNYTDVINLINDDLFCGGTEIGYIMEKKIINDILFGIKPSKPIIVITITDGEPTDSPKNRIFDVIKDTYKILKKNNNESAISFMFSQVGTDKNAQKFLDKLDNDDNIGNYIDCVSNIELEQEQCLKNNGIKMNYKGWLVKLMLGSIDNKYDKIDEINKKKKILNNFRNPFRH